MPFLIRQYSESKKNKNEGWYHCRDPYPHKKKCAVVDVYFDEWVEIYPRTPAMIDIAKTVKVSAHFVRNVMKEFRETGQLSDPAERRAKKKKKITAETTLFTDEEEHFLLSMRAEDPAQPTAAYVHALAVFFNRLDRVIVASWKTQTARHSCWLV